MTQGLLEKLREDRDNSRRSKNQILTNLLGTVIAECETLAKAGKTVRALTNDEIISIIQKTRKKMFETIELISQIPERAEQKTKLLQERELLEVYLPTQLTTEELEKIAIQQEVLDQNLGQIMSFLKKNYAGRYDPKEANAIIREVVACDGR